MADLLTYYPARYQDRTNCLTAMITDDPCESRVRQGLTLTKAVAVTDTDRINLTFFNVSYVKSALVRGETYAFFGKIENKFNRFEMVNPVFEHISRLGRVTNRLMPVYRLTSGLPQHVARLAAEQAVDLLADTLPDYLPQSVRQSRNLCHLGFALRQIHAPSNDENLNAARRRLAFDELFILALGLAFLKETRTVRHGATFQPLDFLTFENSLNFSLTSAQARAIGEITADMSGGMLMNRLLQGDVGSGKTVVAAAACLMAIRGGAQAALMAPTELLANQHYNSLFSLMRNFGVTCGLLTGKLTPKEKATRQREIADGTIQLVIGTHALISNKVAFRNLGLIITDEQHRFGVSQRTKLSEKSDGNGAHSLFMSATPIPRTLALMMYGELDVSVLDELPPGRSTVKTFVVSEEMRPRIDNFIAKTVEDGGQVYVVCPLIERVDDEGRAVADGLNEAVIVRDRLSRRFPEVGLLHGRTPVRERAAVMQRFKAGEIPILVSTTVIEVGVDVPNASLMIVENADRFGLSQLHQLRGRVGRGARESYCVLFNSGSGEIAAKRLKILEKNNDGFQISEFDLQMRGPGEFFGTAQHGLPTLRVADLAADMDLLNEARESALDLLHKYPRLDAPELLPLKLKVQELKLGD
ncbi:ATP-dependent DNA helicase RecG [Clostridia bacterium]|nr:ATP-dependent DNA helicase RecG [Clostridia bacterium]